ncbi:MAG: hypothetical protein Q7S84_04960 [bacterium]|nr:hypothetical protein [bacterium]
MRLATVGTTLLRLCFPPRCVGCGTRLPAHARFEMVCERCFALIPRHRWLTCPVCRARIPVILEARPQGSPRSRLSPGSPLVETKVDMSTSDSLAFHRGLSVVGCPSASLGMVSSSNHRLPRCHPEARFVLAAASDFRNQTVRELIHALKYRPAHRVALPLATLLAEYIAGLAATLPPGILPLIPVPLHPRRERERGWNQAAVLARTLAGFCPGRFEVRDDVLRRIRYTEPQVSFRDRVWRAANISGSFACASETLPLGPIAVLIDDVSTTGATLGEAARVLRHAGVRTVIGLVVASA